MKLSEICQTSLKKKVTEQIKSLIKYAPLFEEFNDWCSKNLQCLDTPTVYRFFRHLDTPTVYRFFQQLSKSLSEANYWFINDQNSPSHHYIDFPWNDISNSSLYSEKQGFNPLAIAIIWPHLEYNFYKIIDKPIVSDLIKGIINYTINILKDPKMFEAFIIPKIIKELAMRPAMGKESLIESLIYSLDGKESVINMIQKKKSEFEEKNEFTVKLEELSQFIIETVQDTLAIKRIAEEINKYVLTLPNTETPDLKEKIQSYTQQYFILPLIIPLIEKSEMERAGNILYFLYLQNEYTQEKISNSTITDTQKDYLKIISKAIKKARESLE